ncbi:MULTISPECIES: aldehyde dehydrogenase family protein [unclassified Mesorhizobium]|uniref:aldehyde dehydrogenase family protein n=3 Tax=Mesorhizobium TaxID=68287 RepID=UPI000FD38D0A|nr:MULTISPECIES: aldehyde dehydrogenase family protein [unclassified Mesorhizobium]RUV30466.1 aldehyde dehydrogenase family protein [Mesorhizobium sp. M5C.F.Ca.IN.020.32.2.1]RWH58440.1 MAG: aldehyde dehydrogenase family protein [Mesorhizobium sp.]RWI76718.1 MAG: aldehyde dehydrogenase family protein [Mesorhizobium sp.]RWI79460.1 MAG: aldehyde dehydrogenase family protein [Mesorhizobium sp.]RWJ04681.1 MAG: aldehyde dehydrogenase family protein [Mesorhizobium sp.]
MTIVQAPVALRQPIDGRHRQMFVDGAWLDARSGRIMETRNPATGAVIATVPRGDRDDIELAVAAARRAFDGPWSRYKPYERQVLLLRIADLFEKHWEEISRSDTTDMGMPIVRTRANRNRVIGMLRYYAGMATSLHGETIENSLPGEIVSFTRKEPVGVVGAIIPWNAPTAASIWKIGPALAAGCTVVLKPSEEAPLTPLLITDIMNEAGVPPGVVNIVTGTGAEAGAALSEHMGVDKIVFTGSTATGQSIVRASAGNLKRVSLELGGKSPVIVCADADLDRAVPVAAMSVFANSGQICIAGSRLFVERSIHDEFVERLAVYAKGLRIGDGIDPATEIGPLVSEKQLQRVASYLEAGTAEGATLVTGGERLMEGALAAGNFVAPTVFAGVSDDMRIAREEIFGPVISALPFDTLDEAVERANNTPYGLAAGVFTQNLATAHQLSRKIRAGSVWVNTYHAIDPAMPFGGYKMSGYGREGGAEHLDEYLNTKGVFIKID